MFPLDLNDLAHNFSLVYGRDKRTDGRTDGRMDRRNAMRITMWYQVYNVSSTTDR